MTFLRGVSFIFQQSLAIIDVENIDSLLSKWLNSASLRAVEERVKNAKCQVLVARDYADRHPVIALFLAVVAVLGFLPIVVFLAFASGSLVVILGTALSVFLGVIFVSLVPLLTVLIPILMIGGITGVFIYFAYRSVVKMLEVIERLKDMLMSLLSKIVVVSFGFGRDREVKQPAPPVVDCCEDVVPTADEEFFDEEFYYGNDSE